MIKKTACILAALALTACAVDKKGDWATDCNRNSSENAGALNDCKAATADVKDLNSDMSKHHKMQAPVAKTENSKNRSVKHTQAGSNSTGYKGGDKADDAAHVE